MNPAITDAFLCLQMEVDVVEEVTIGVKGNDHVEPLGVIMAEEGVEKGDKVRVPRRGEEVKGTYFILQKTALIELYYHVLGGSVPLAGMGSITDELVATPDFLSAGKKGVDMTGGRVGERLVLRTRRQGDYTKQE